MSITATRQLLGTMTVSLSISLLATGEVKATSFKFTKIADTSGPFKDLKDVFGPVLNNTGTVAFSAILDDGRTGIFTSSGGTITPVVDTSGQFSLIGDIAINDSNTVAFVAATRDGHGEHLTFANIGVGEGR